MIGDFEPKDPPRQSILELSWTHVDILVNVIAHDIRPKKFHRIVAIARGGLIPATMLSHKLDIPLEVISCSSYKGTRKTLDKPITIEGWEDGFASDKTVFIDDIMDTGDTWDAIMNKCFVAGVSIARLWTLAKKDKARFPGFMNFGLHVQGDMWVKFPWEAPIT